MARKKRKSSDIASSSEPRPPKRLRRETNNYICSCSRRCQKDTPLKPSTWYRHAKYREDDERVKKLQEAAHQLVPEEAGSSRRLYAPDRGSPVQANGASPRAYSLPYHPEDDAEHHGFTPEPSPDRQFDDSSDEHTHEDALAPDSAAPSSRETSPGLFTSLPGTPVSIQADGDASDEPFVDGEPFLEDDLLLEDNRDASPSRPSSRIVDFDADLPEDILRTEDPGAPLDIRLVELRIAQDFVDALKGATLDEEGLSDDVLTRIRNPPCFPLKLDPDDPEDSDLVFSFREWIQNPTAPDAKYTNTRRNFLDHSPDADIPSLPRLKSIAAELTGVVPWYHDMCINSCIAYTGPFAHLQRCPYVSCGAPRYLSNPSSTSRRRSPQAQRRFLTIPLGPQLQALYRSRESAEAMQYRDKATRGLFEDLELHDDLVEAYSDYLHGDEYIDAVERGDLQSNDICLMLSIDGAQLYAHKSSDCWFYIWVLLDLPPDLRFKKKHVLIGGIFPGPNKPKNIDSFIFPGLHHAVALMREGLAVWDAYYDLLLRRNLFIPLGTADGPGMAYLNGRVGHTGRAGCRYGCPIVGRHKRGSPIYYPVCLQPDRYDVEGCCHDDFDMESWLVPGPDEQNPRAESLARYERDLRIVLNSRTQKEYEANRLATGIAKPSIFLGIPENRRYPITGLFPGDIMHQIINLVEILMGLWRGKLDCDKADDRSTWDWAVLVGDVWEAHGNEVERCRRYLPGSFGRAPRSPADKLSSGYKAEESLMWLFGLGPALLLGVLPDKYWDHYCKLVRGFRLVNQHLILAGEVSEAHEMLVSFARDFEHLYYQRRPERLHFVRQSIHNLYHSPTETVRTGPLPVYAQWLMERSIGDIEEELRSDSNPYGNLAEIAVRRCQMNALLSMAPQLDNLKKPTDLAHGAFDLGNGFALLRRMDPIPRTVSAAEAAAIRRYFNDNEPNISYDTYLKSPKVCRWARLQIPSGQVARSLWKEQPMEDASKAVRQARNIKMQKNDKVLFAEVQYFFRMQSLATAYVMLVVYSPPDEALWKASHQTLYSCRPGGIDSLAVMKVSHISSVVGMVPHPYRRGHEHLQGRVFVVEKPGMDLLQYAGTIPDELPDEDDDRRYDL